MSKVKNTKNELKAQRDALRRYERYLPTLQLKKQQLQLEVRQVEVRLAESVALEQELLARVQPWVALFTDPEPWGDWLRIDRAVTDVGNVAGVSIPVLREVVFARTPPALASTATWVDEGVALLADLARVRLERTVLEQQKELLLAELRTTNQRVNLFERVKIPECREAIRRIRISLGDARTLDVARGKIAKARTQMQETAQ